MKRRYLLSLLASSSLCAFPSISGSLNYPNKAIKIIVGSSPGALSDVAARIYAEKVTTRIGKPVIVENIAGASSTIAINNFLKSENDGHTLLVVANTVFTYPYLTDKVNYQPEKDFAPVAELARGPGMLVIDSKLPYKNLNDFVEAAKKAPTQLSYASGGLGTTSHLPMEMFQQESGIEILHIPYKGIAPAVIDVIGGRVDSMMGTPTSMLSALQSGQLRPLAVTSESRLPEFPDVPTFKEMGYPNVSYTIFIALVAHKNIAPDLRQAIAAIFNKEKYDKELISNLSKLGQGVDHSMNDLGALDDFIFKDSEKYAKLIKEKNIRLN